MPRTNANAVQNFPQRPGYRIGFYGGCVRRAGATHAVVFALTDDARNGEVTVDPWRVIGETGPCNNEYNAVRAADRFVRAHLAEVALSDAWGRDIDAEIAEWRRYTGRAA